MTGLDKLFRAAVILVLASLLFVAVKGIWQAGWNARDLQVQQQLTDALTEQRKQIEADLADSRGRDKALIHDLAAASETDKTRISALERRMRSQQHTPQETPDETNEQAEPDTPPLVGRCVLDDGTIRLLNDARAGRDSGDPDSAIDSDAEGEAATATPPYVTGADLVLSDAAMAAQYNELAKIHNTLVDWVNTKLK